METYPLAYNITRVENWAREKGILKNGSTLAQATKTKEEARELQAAVYGSDEEGIKDGIGDVLVTLIIQAEMQGMTLEHCLEHAYQQIKDRRGEMVNGTFVKEEQQAGHRVKCPTDEELAETGAHPNQDDPCAGFECYEPEGWSNMEPTKNQKTE